MHRAPITMRLSRNLRDTEIDGSRIEMLKTVEGRFSQRRAVQVFEKNQFQ